LRATDTSDARARIIATSRHSVTRDAVGVGLEDLVSTTRKINAVGVATAPPSDVSVAANTASGGRGAADIGSIGFEVRTTDASDARAHIIATSRHSVTRDAVGVGLEDFVGAARNVIRAVSVATAPARNGRDAALSSGGASDTDSIGPENCTSETSDARTSVIATRTRAVARDAAGAGLEDIVGRATEIVRTVGVPAAPTSDVMVTAIAASPGVSASNARSRGFEVPTSITRHTTACVIAASFHSIRHN